MEIELSLTKIELALKLIPPLFIELALNVIKYALMEIELAFKLFQSPFIGLALKVNELALKLILPPFV